jgi:electron transfer flavoprotein alpha subunit
MILAVVTAKSYADVIKQQQKRGAKLVLLSSTTDSIYFIILLPLHLMQVMHLNVVGLPLSTSPFQVKELLSQTKLSTLPK